MGYRTRFDKAVLCQMSAEQFEYLFQFSQRHRISMSLALQRMLRIVRTLESMPEAHWADDIMLRELAQRERQKAAE